MFSGRFLRNKFRLRPHSGWQDLDFHSWFAFFTHLNNVKVAAEVGSTDLLAAGRGTYSESLS
jgi:hypothetical protein